MSGVTQSNKVQPWEQCLADLNERDGAVEITGLSAQRGAARKGDSAASANGRDVQDDSSHHVAPSFRVRVLACRPAGIVVDQPTNPEEAHYFQQGAVVRMLVVDGSARWELMTTVTSRVRFKLNENSVVSAIVLTRPHEVNSVQRREFFRVSTAAAKLSPVELTPAVKTKTDPTAEVAETFGPEPKLLPFTGKLVNVGGGGMGVEASRDVAFTLSLCRRFRCVVKLPSMDEPLEVNCTLVHLETQAQGMHYLGLRFEMASPAARRRVEDQICHFTSWLQRQQLQRMKRSR